nr:ChaN family lipoprotein [Actibacterium sp. 188UL27-1]
MVGVTSATAEVTICQSDVPGEALFSADVVLIGEQHDNPAHHNVQACIISVRQPAALVFEMISPPKAKSLTTEDRSSEATLRSKLEWDQSGWPDFAMYYPIFVAAPQAKIYGAALRRDVMRAAVTDGAAAQFEGDVVLFDLDMPLLPDEQIEREQMQFDAHCQAMPKEMMGGMVEAQRLRDAELARVTLQALKDTGGPVIVILGNGHARTDWGVPVYLRAADPTINMMSIGQIEGRLLDNPPYDVALAGPVMARDDPCAAFTDQKE